MRSKPARTGATAERGKARRHAPIAGLAVAARGRRRSEEGRTHFERRDGVATITLDRPTRGNRIDLAIAQSLCTAAEEIAHDDSLRVVVLRASGASFCLGEEDDPETRSVPWVEALARITQPLIAVIQGDAIAEGLELALACDLRIASKRAHFAMPQAGQGRLTSRGGSQRLPRLVGRSRALDLLLSSRRVDADEAIATGLVTRVATHARLATAAASLISDLVDKAPIALRYAKEAVWKGSDMTLDQGIRLEEDLYALLQTSSDRSAGIRAFLTKQRPRFHGQ